MSADLAPRMDDDVVDDRILLSYMLPLTPDVGASITAPFPLTNAEWARLLELLHVMRAGLVQEQT